MNTTKLINYLIQEQVIACGKGKSTQHMNRNKPNKTV